MAKVKSPRVPLTDVTMTIEDDVSELLRAGAPFKVFENARDGGIEQPVVVRRETDAATPKAGLTAGGTDSVRERR